MEDLQKLLENAGLTEAADTYGKFWQGEKEAGKGYVRYKDSYQPIAGAFDNMPGSDEDFARDFGGSEQSDLLTDGEDTDRIQRENQEKIVKLVAATAHMMDRADRPGVKNPSKSNISLYINFIISQLVEDLGTQGYDVNWTEHGWED